MCLYDASNEILVSVRTEILIFKRHASLQLDGRQPYAGKARNRIRYVYPVQKERLSTLEEYGTILLQCVSKCQKINRKTKK